MHGKIFQITQEKVLKENFLNENTLKQGDGHYYDYCAEISDEERKFHIAYLVENILPKGMFTLVEENIIRYNGGIEDWKRIFVETLQEKAKAVTIENCTEWIGAMYGLKEYLKDPLDTGYHFYMDEQGLYEEAEQSYEFLCTVSGLEPGTLLYIGGVIDFHF